MQNALTIEGKTVVRRSELEVKMDIIRVVAQGATKPTQIMYKANLSWVALLGHLKALMEFGLLREVEFVKRREYECTSKGIELLRSYQGVVSAMCENPAEQLSF